MPDAHLGGSERYGVARTASADRPTVDIASEAQLSHRSSSHTVRAASVAADYRPVMAAR